MTAAVAFAILALQTRGYRRFELAIAGVFGIVLLDFAYDLAEVGVDAGGFAGGLGPGFEGTDSILLAVGILGATVMPHVVYLHSALTQDRVRPSSGRAGSSGSWRRGRRAGETRGTTASTSAAGTWSP